MNTHIEKLRSLFRASPEALQQGKELLNAMDATESDITSLFSLHTVDSFDALRLHLQTEFVDHHRELSQRAGAKEERRIALLCARRLNIFPNLNI